MAEPPSYRRRRLAGASLAAALLAGWGGSALAQAVERNLPPAPRPTAPTIVGPNAVPGLQDDTPIGPALQGLVLLGPTDEVQAGAGAGVDAHRVKRIDTDAGRRVLQRFIGRPISRRLIGEMEAEIARYYRGRGFPFVALSTPPQELTGGILQVRVVEFHAGRIRATGVSRTPRDYVTDRVRLKPGDPIDSDRLGEDLRWLNRYPFRQTQAIFAPGGSLGAADLNLTSVEARPWRVYGGYANSGSPTTGMGRGYLGATLGLPRDIVLSYQFTASSDFWSGEGHPRYLGHGAAFTVPTAPRQQLEVLFDAIETNEAVGPFDVRLQTFDLNVGYRFALSNLVRLPGDLNFGAEGSRQERKVGFGGVDVAASTVRVYQVYVGWSDFATDRLGRTEANVSLHVSPGGLGDSNSDDAFNLYTLGRMTDATYGYIDVTGTRTFRLPKRWEVSSSIQARFANKPLPDSQRIGLGGTALVRGYNLDDGAFDSGLVWRNELRAPSLNLLHGRFEDELSPYAFVDASYGWVVGGPGSGHPASIGAGADYRIGRTVDGGVLFAYALSDAPDTKSGDVRIQARLTLSY